MTGSRRRLLFAGPIETRSGFQYIVSSPVWYQSSLASDGVGAAASSADFSLRPAFFTGKENTRRPWFVYHRGYRIRRPHRLFEAVGGDVVGVVH